MEKQYDIFLCVYVFCRIHTFIYALKRHRVSLSLVTHIYIQLEHIQCIHFCTLKNSLNFIKVRGCFSNTVWSYCTSTLSNIPECYTCMRAIMCMCTHVRNVVGLTASINMEQQRLSCPYYCS